MRLRLLIACAVTACALTPAVDARAATTMLKVRSCQVGDTAKERQATFYARMHAVKGTHQMAMRFTLINRAGAGPPTVVDNPAFVHWRKSRPGVKSYGYAQSVTGLEKGGIYAVQVRFRWKDAHGHVIHTVKRTSDVCRQQGELPNLTVTRVAAKAGDASGAEAYAVDVTNAGHGDAHAVQVDLFVDGAAADSSTLDVLKAGETTTVRFSGPLCRRGLRMVVDRRDKVIETNEDDNVLRASCPPIGA
jgi:CARDB protein